jgi:uncharacterized membrane protein
MAPSKQARRSRQAVSAKKRTSHGGSRSRTAALSGPATPSGNGRAAARTDAVGKGSAAADATTTDVAQPTGGGARTWVRTHPLQLTTWVLSLFALAVSIYLTITHYDSSVTLACSDKGVVNCAKVTTSTQSMVFGIFPVAVLGLGFYLFMAAINSPFGWRLDRREVKWLRLGSVIVGMGFVLYLIYAEVIQIGNICLWCTSVHVATFVIFALLVYEATSWTSATPKARR